MPAEPSMKIMVVDDMSTMRRIIKNVFKQINFTNIQEAENGQQALEMLRGETFQFVIADWNMPVMTGLELVKAMRADSKLRDIPVLMVTAESQHENLIQAVQAGVNGYIAKPFTAEALQEKMSKIFK